MSVVLLDDTKWYVISGNQRRNLAKIRHMAENLGRALSVCNVAYYIKKKAESENRSCPISIANKIPEHKEKGDILQTKLRSLTSVCQKFNTDADKEILNKLPSIIKKQTYVALAKLVYKEKKDITTTIVTDQLLNDNGKDSDKDSDDVYILRCITSMPITLVEESVLAKEDDEIVLEPLDETAWDEDF